MSDKKNNKGKSSDKKLWMRIAVLLLVAVICLGIIILPFL